jgi:hypothetical protein
VTTHICEFEPPDGDAFAVTTRAESRAAVSATLWAAAEHHIVAEWICCEPLAPGHKLCAKGYAALGMVKTLLVDSDPEKAWNPNAPLLDAVLSMLPDAARLQVELASMRHLLRTENQRANSAIDRETTTEDAEEEQRLALSAALGLGIGAPWDAIRERAGELAESGNRAAEEVDADTVASRAAQVITMMGAEIRELKQRPDRAAVLREVADECDKAGAAYAARAQNEHAAGVFALMETFLRKASEAEYVATPCDFAGCEPNAEPCSTHERLMAHAEGDHELCAPDCGPELRRVVDEMPPADTRPCRGDGFESWLKVQRDLCSDYPSPAWNVMDGLLDQYRLHADTGTPLSEHVCEGRAVGDCDCLENVPYLPGAAELEEKPSVKSAPSKPVAAGEAVGPADDYEAVTGHSITCLVVAGGGGDPDCPTCHPKFGIPGCTCRPWTRQTDPPRYLDQPGDTLDMIGGWGVGDDCPHHTVGESR